MLDALILTPTPSWHVQDDLMSMWHKGWCADWQYIVNLTLAGREIIWLFLGYVMHLFEVRREAYVGTLACHISIKLEAVALNEGKSV
jgi:hypothetical protein